MQARLPLRETHQCVSSACVCVHGKVVMESLGEDDSVHADGACKDLFS